MRALFAALLLASGCSTSPHFYPTFQQQSISLGAGQLETGGLAFITPSTVTGQEQEKQGVALTFAVATVLVNFLADIVTVALDPRVEM